LSYEVYFSSSTKISAVGMIINLQKRTKELIDKSFSDLDLYLKKYKLNTDIRVIVTEEVNYKEENVELFIGYLFHNLDLKTLKKINKNKTLTIYSNPTMDYLIAPQVNENNISSACNDIIKYSIEKNAQLIGPFTEIYYDKHKPNIYIMAHDLVREEYENELIKEYNNKKYKEPFILNREILGTWKIIEILPNINFNPNKQKSNPKTKYQIIEFFSDGTTNYNNLKWSGNKLFIVNKDYIIANSIILKKIDNKEYLEIRMTDLSEKYYHAKPITYIYEKEK